MKSPQTSTAPSREPSTARGREFAEDAKVWWVHSEDDFDEEGWEVSILGPVLAIEAEAVRDYREALERLVRAHDNYFPGAIGFGVVDKAEEVENATQQARALLTASAEEKP